MNFRLVCVSVVVQLALVSLAGAQSQLPSFSKTFLPDTVGPASTSTLRFDITNPSASTVTDLAFVDNLPAGLTVADPSGADSSCGGTLDAVGGTITLSEGGVSAGGSCSISVNVTGSTPGTHTNISGDLTSSAGNSGNATADLVVADDRPGFSKSFSPSSISFGSRSRLSTLR